MINTISSAKHSAVFAAKRGEEMITNAYSNDEQARLKEALNFVEPLYGDELTADSAPVDPEKWERFKDVRYVFSTWTMPDMKAETIQTYFPNLEAVFYAAGSVQGFARPFLEVGVKVFSAWEANAIPVAEYTLAQIILSGKRFFHSARLYRDEGHAEASRIGRQCRGNYDLVVGLLGCGAIGRLVAEYLKSFEYKVLAFDPFLSEEQAEELGVTLVSLHEIFEQSDIVSNHLANNEQTQGMLDASCFNRMKQDGVFINTGRGAQVTEDDLVRALEDEPLRLALLDVTWPEPVREDHPFRSLPNCVLTPHIAGSLSAEIKRMGQFMTESYETYRESQEEGRKEPLPREVTLDMLDHMA